MHNQTITDAWITDPFPHAVIDDLWDPSDLQVAAAEFPAPHDPRWQTYTDPEEQGKRAAGADAWGPAVRAFFETTSSPTFTSYLTALTGIADLHADTLGGGMHETGEGGKLGMHVDFNLHPVTGWPRRLNLLVFLNEEWDCDWGGCLYLGADRQITVEPVFNRTVIFECSDASWHGHPHPITGAYLRRSLAAYYYTETGPIGTAHDTIYRRD